MDAGRCLKSAVGHMHGCFTIAGMKVAVAEKPYGMISSENVGGVGGTCVLRGCVPKKLMVYASEYAEMMKDAGGFG